MSNEPTKASRPTRQYPKLSMRDEKTFSADWPSDFKLESLLEMRTHEAAAGVYTTAVSALGKSAEKYGNLASAMFAEMEPRDAVEAMPIAQMTATHVAMADLADRMSQQTYPEVRKSCERSMTRLGRTYLAQMDALKKYRGKAQQTVRVERVNVESGGQAIVGDVSHRAEV